MEIKRYRKRHCDVETVAFLGWDNFTEVFTWVNGAFYFVPEGHEHPLRYDRERAGPDRLAISSGEAFGVIVNETGEIRANRNDIIVKTDEGQFFVLTEDRLLKEYAPIFDPIERVDNE